MKNFDSESNFKNKFKSNSPELKVIHTKKSEDEFIKKNIFAGGVVIKKNTTGWKIALQTIPEKREEGYWGLPKGMLDEEESDKEKLLKTAKKKIEAETGVYEDNLDLLNYLGRIERPSRSKRIWKKIHYFVFLTRQNKLQPRTEKHTADWFSLDLEDLSTVPEQNEVIASTISLLKKSGF